RLASTAQSRRCEHAHRSYRSLVFFGRSVITTLAVISGALGFMTGVKFKSAEYDPHSFAIGVAFLLAVACTAIAFMLYRRRVAKLRMVGLETQVEDLADKNWELHESEMH